MVSRAGVQLIQPIPIDHRAALERVGTILPSAQTDFGAKLTQMHNGFTRRSHNVQNA